MPECFKVTIAPKPGRMTFGNTDIAANNHLTGVNTEEVNHVAAQTTLAAISKGGYINSKGARCILSNGDDLLKESEFIANKEFEKNKLYHDWVKSSLFDCVESLGVARSQVDLY